MNSGSKADPPPAAPVPPRRLRELIGLGETARRERLAYFDLGPADSEALRAQRPLAEGIDERAVEDVYDHLLGYPELQRLLAEPGRIPALKDLQRGYFRSLFEGRHDDEYFEGRLRLGDVHQRIGLRPHWYMGAFALFLRHALRNLLAATPEGRRLLPAAEALVKVIFLDVSLTIDTYIYGGFVDRALADELARAARVAEEALRDRAEVERMKDELTSMVIHDLKNPVNGIAMMVQLALRKSRELPDVHRNYLLQIERTSREMMRLIQNLLEISKIEEGKMPVARAPIVLAEVADEVAAEYGPVAEQSKRRLAVAVATGLPPALGDRALLKRVLINLVVNGLRHSGSADVRIEGGADAAAGQVTLRVIDFGHGIPEEEQGRLFEKFRSVRRSPTGNPSGDTGLGLPFCKLAVESMGGRIAVTSAPGAPTVFSVTLPAQPRA